MKILCVIDSLGSGGAQRQLVELAKGFRERGNYVSFLVYHEYNFFKDELDEQSIPVSFVIELNYLKRLLKMRKIIRKGKYDVVLSFLEAANFICEFAGLPWRNWKLIVGERSANPEILKSFKRKFYRWFHLFADHVVANSHENLKIVKRICPILSNRKCHVIYNLVDFDYWKPASDYNIPTSRKLNLVVAASHQYLKNAKNFIEAVDELNEEERERLNVNWYGDESPDNSFHDAIKMVEEKGFQKVFKFHKATNNIREKLQYADIVGLFSLYEGLPNVLCEAMTIGKPIISSSVSDIPVLLSCDTNCIFNPFDVADIAKTISYIISLPPKKLVDMGNINRIKGLKLFKKNKIISAYISLFL